MGILKSFFLLFLIININFNIVAQADESSKIIFEDISLTEAIEKAQIENKLIFVDIFATWCGSCKKMKKYTYTDSTFSNFMNEHFINLSYDYERGEGVEFVKNYTVDRWPSLFLMSAKGKVLNKTTGYIPPKDFLTITKIIHQINFKPKKEE